MTVDGVDPADLPALVAAAYPSISPDLSLAAVFAAALACTMQRLDGRSEFTIGLPVGNRSDRRRRDLVGPLMELHPGRTWRSMPDDTFASLVERTLASVIDMLRATRRDPSAHRGDFEMVVNVVPRRRTERSHRIRSRCRGSVPPTSTRRTRSACTRSTGATTSRSNST